MNRNEATRTHTGKRLEKRISEPDLFEHKLRKAWLSQIKTRPTQAGEIKGAGAASLGQQSNFEMRRKHRVGERSEQKRTRQGGRELLALNQVSENGRQEGWRAERRYKRKHKCQQLHKMRQRKKNKRANEGQGHANEAVRQAVETNRVKELRMSVQVKEYEKSER